MKELVQIQSSGSRSDPSGLLDAQRGLSRVAEVLSMICETAILKDIFGNGALHYAVAPYLIDQAREVLSECAGDPCRSSAQDHAAGRTDEASAVPSAGAFQTGNDAMTSASGVLEATTDDPRPVGSATARGKLPPLHELVRVAPEVEKLLGKSANEICEMDLREFASLCDDNGFVPSVSFRRVAGNGGLRVGVQDIADAMPVPED